MSRSLSQEEFLHRMHDLYGDQYDLSQVVYQNYTTPVKVICQKHGLFEKKPNVLLRGYGCPICARERPQASFEERKEDYARRAEKRRETLLRRYGVDNAMKLDSVKEKVKQTCLTRYAVENPMQCSEVIQKVRETNVKRYGKPSYLQSSQGLAHLQAVMTERYGVPNFMQSDAAQSVIPVIREKSVQTQLARYGAEHYAQSGVFHSRVKQMKQKEYATKMKNGTWNTSHSEQQLEELLLSVFSEEDVKVQYKSDLYPYACDFYIVSRNLYIELNACWTHNNHWYDENRDVDAMTVWHEKHNAFYDNAVETWTVRDLQKRAAARAADLNYVVFWCEDLRDAALWFAMGCPDGRDWEKEYSWLPDRTLFFDGKQAHFDIWSLVKEYQFPVLFQQELMFWQANKLCQNGIPAQAQLYFNRYKYLGKTPDELSCMEILRGLRISGMVKGYTRFDVSAMEQALQRYDIQSVLDPCAGWGERLLCCFQHGVTYQGVDINEALVPGYERLLSDLGCTAQRVQFENSAAMTVQGTFDAVITCPPYGNTEIYSDKGAENLSESAFLEWWRQVVRQCKVRGVSYFCFQINQKWKEKLSEIVKSEGFSFQEEIQLTPQVSHFHRKKGVITKREFESMMVLRR